MSEQHRKEVLAKVVPYLESVMDNIAMQEKSMENNAFGLLINNFVNILKVSNKTKGDKEFVEFVRLVDNLLDEKVFSPLGMSQGKGVTKQTKENPRPIAVDMSDLPDELKRMVQESGAEALKIKINKETNEVEIEGNLHDVPREVITDAIKHMAGIGVPKEEIMKAVHKNLGGF